MSRGEVLTKKVHPMFSFWSKVDPEVFSQCWLWLGKKNRDGYGSFHPPRNQEKQRKVGAHRHAYENLRGPIPGGLTLDHLCRTRNCVNPFHLEPVTNAENVMRGEGICAKNKAKTHCSKGHPLAEPNLFICGGRRYCRECHNKRSRQSMQKQRDKKRV